MATMKTTKYIVWSGLISVILFLGVSIYNFGELERKKKEAYLNNNYRVETPSLENYDSLCNLEKDIFFPSRNVKYAKLTKNNFWKQSKTIKGKDLKELLQVLNDSASYEWGELGTPEIHYYISYYNEDNKCVGVT